MSPLVEIPMHLALAIQLAAASPVEPASAPLEAPPAGAIVNTGDAGLTDEAWLQSLREFGAAAGYGALAGRIFATSSGRVYVPVGADRHAIRALKQNVGAVSRIVTAATRARSERLAALLGRPALLSELYIAHLLGTDRAARLLAKSARQPRTPAAELMPEAALAHPAVFFVSGRLATSAETVRKLSSAFEAALSRATRDARAAPLAARLKPADHAAIDTRDWRTSVAIAR